MGLPRSSSSRYASFLEHILSHCSASCRIYLAGYCTCTHLCSIPAERHGSSEDAGLSRPAPPPLWPGNALFCLSAHQPRRRRERIPRATLPFRGRRLTGAKAAAAGPPWPSLNYGGIDGLSDPDDYESLIRLSAVEASEMLCSGRVTAVRYATALLKRMRETECLNAWAAVDPGRVLSEAAAVDALAAAGADTRPLCGLPIGAREPLSRCIHHRFLMKIHMESSRPAPVVTVDFHHAGRFSRCDAAAAVRVCLFTDLHPQR